MASICPTCSHTTHTAIWLAEDVFKSRWWLPLKHDESGFIGCVGSAPGTKEPIIILFPASLYINCLRQSVCMQTVWVLAESKILADPLTHCITGEHETTAKSLIALCLSDVKNWNIYDFGVTLIFSLCKKKQRRGSFLYCFWRTSDQRAPWIWRVAVCWCNLFIKKRDLGWRRCNCQRSGSMCGSSHMQSHEWIYGGS